MSTAKCAACGFTREPESLIAYWPVGAPERKRYVCRPDDFYDDRDEKTREITRSGHRPFPDPCFRRVVMSVATHTIAAP